MLINSLNMETYTSGHTDGLHMRSYRQHTRMIGGPQSRVAVRNTGGAIAAMSARHDKTKSVVATFAPDAA